MEHVLYLGTLVSVWIIVALAANLVIGYTGMMAMGQAAYLGVGAYVAAGLNILLGVNFYMSLVAATLGGAVVATFAGGDPTRQGIDIAGKAGQPVRASADGVVVYSGSGLVGYGELVIVKHNDQWLSAYGHNRARLVNEGQVVKAGQQVAEMGRSGASRDMLHFEIRYNGKPVDPQQYLPKR